MLEAIGLEDKEIIVKGLLLARDVAEDGRSFRSDLTDTTR